jgi:hypothetical protein
MAAIYKNIHVKSGNKRMFFTSPPQLYQIGQKINVENLELLILGKILSNDDKKIDLCVAYHDACKRYAEKEENTYFTYEENLYHIFNGDKFIILVSKDDFDILNQTNLKNRSTIGTNGINMLPELNDEDKQLNYVRIRLKQELRKYALKKKL